MLSGRVEMFVKMYVKVASPVIMNSCGVVAAEDRKVWNSSRKTLMG